MSWCPMEKNKLQMGILLPCEQARGLSSKQPTWKIPFMLPLRPAHCTQPSGMWCSHLGLLTALSHQACSVYCCAMLCMLSMGGRVGARSQDLTILLQKECCHPNQRCTWNDHICTGIFCPCEEPIALLRHTETNRNSSVCPQTVRAETCPLFSVH